ncbi:hypothetical protein MMC25_000404 [Agyrium rufum]|nr:hypothetical protein [Agyrium rufum]
MAPVETTELTSLPDVQTTERNNLAPKSTPSDTDEATLNEPPKTIPSRLIEREDSTTAQPPQPPIERVDDPICVTPKERLGDKSEWIDCDFCERRTQTRVERRPVEREWV